MYIQMNIQTPTPDQAATASVRLRMVSAVQDSSLRPNTYTRSIR